MEEFDFEEYDAEEFDLEGFYLKFEGFDLIREAGKALERAERESLNNIYYLKPEILDRTVYITHLLKGKNLTVNFDAATNSIEIEALDYVFDSYVDKMQTVFQAVDVFSIDAQDDGRVCVSMKINNAANVKRREY